MGSYRAPILTLKRLLIQGIIPVLILDYTSRCVNFLLYRKPYGWLLATCLKKDDNYTFSENILLTSTTEGKVNVVLNDVSKLYLDSLDFLERDELNDCISVLINTVDVILDKYSKTDSDTFTRKDFDKLTELGYLSRFDPKYWRLDD